MGDNAKDMIKSYYASWLPEDSSGVLKHFTEDAVFEDLAFEATFEGHEAISGFVLMTYAGAPDFAVTPTEILVDGEKASASWTMTGTHSGDFPGMPATGKPFTVRACSMMTLKNGLIHTIRDFWSPTDFMKQVGLLPPQA